MIVLLFKNDYLVGWPMFFDNLLDLIKTGNGDAAIETFLNICIMIDEEVVCKYINRGENELAENTLLKDVMREKDIPKLVETWINEFTNYYKSNSTIGEQCLKLFGLYVSWIDIGLILQDRLLNSLFQCFSMPALRIAACECLTCIVSKGMSSSDKLKMLQDLNLIGILGNIADSDDPEFEERVSKLLNITGLELCSCYDDTTFGLRFVALEVAHNLFPLIIKYLANEYDDTSSCLFPFLSSYLLAQKRLARNNTCNLSREEMVQLLEVLALKMKFEVDADADCGGDDGILFQEMRKVTLFNLVSKNSYGFNCCY
jgi:exportin-T